MDALEAIKKIPYLDDATEIVSAYLAKEAVRQQVQANQIVLLQGENTPAVFIVGQGGLKAVQMSPTGREHVLRFIEAGETFNEISVLTGNSNQVTVIALEESILWKVDQAVVWRMMAHYPETAKVVIQHLARRTQMLLQLIEGLSLRSIEARLARFLLDNASDNVMERAIWATQAELANRLGTVPDVLHRALHTLASENLIEVKRRKITILNRNGLQHRSELDK